MKKEDYYGDNKKLKIVDFILGFFGIYIVNLIIFSITRIPLYAISRLQYFRKYNYLIGIGDNLSIVICIIITIVIIKIFFKKKRRFISIGSLVAIGIPLLLLGACELMFGG
ncbi:hypothetical protein HOD20_02765 [archaeon]|jgi:hypothetical protein|nr:hypothetical protein [archaeon]MBT4351427.1 hypothetical protein [archaeon]MBT4647282.1 hypothetical protein [archaeon]MBT6821155.1 hypothetical protein [archaeon]MBT7391677.1 hypothetical protein [archaeon]